MDSEQKTECDRLECRILEIKKFAKTLEEED